MEYTDWLNENEDFKPQEENGQYEDWYTVNYGDILGYALASYIKIK